MDARGRLLAQVGAAKELWVRVLGLPLHLWSREVFRKIGFCCGGFIAVDEDTACMANLQWARILVKSVGRVVHGKLHAVIGNASFSFLSRWEVPPCFLLVVPRSCSNKLGVQEDRDDGVGDSRASYGVGKSPHPLPTGDGDVPCSYMKKLIGEAATVKKAAEGGVVVVEKAAEGMFGRVTRGLQLWFGLWATAFGLPGDWGGGPKFN